MKRIRHFFNTLGTNWSNDPAARGAAKMTAGAVLVAEGLFGVARRAASRGKNNAGGVVGAFMGMVFGLVFAGAGWMIAPSPFEDELRTTGEIVGADSSRGDDGTMYAAVYAFEVNGREYRFNSPVRSSSRPTIGQSVEIAYSESNPENARRLGGIDGNFHWIFIGTGLFVMLLSFFSLLVCLALIGFGVWLFMSGRADRKSVDASGSFFSDLFSLAKRANSGEIDVDRTAVGQSGNSQGDTDFFSTAAAAVAGAGGASMPDASQRASDAPPPSAPPEGWYPDPDNNAQLRWWDGRQWTEHRREA